MIARQDAQAAGIIRDRFVKTKFSGKIRNRIFNCAAGAGLSISVVSSQILLEFLTNLFQLAQESFVLRKFLQPRLARKLQHSHRIMVCPVPEFWIEQAKESARGRLPGPPKVETQLTQRLQRRWQDRRYVVSLKSRHARGC